MKIGDLVRSISPMLGDKLYIVTYVDELFVCINGGKGLLGRKTFEVVNASTW